MPPKARELIQELEITGFKTSGGKGSHRSFVHPNVTKPVVVSGKTSADTQHYQIKAVKKAIEELNK